MVRTQEDRADEPLTSLPPDQVPGAPAAGRPKPCALLWNESLLWGIMAWRALREAGLPFALLRAEEIRRGALEDYGMIFVPGGWAVNKRAALGEAGCQAIRRFVTAGGSYLGICGGAGLATREGIALLPVGRMASARRVASFSGAIGVSPVAHPIWEGVEAPIFSAWWPSQLVVDDPEIRVLATYGEAQPDAFSSDIPVESGNRLGWPALEERYGIRLDPARLRGEPAVLEGRFGDGRVILSLLHFDTPGDERGRAVLRNLWRYLAGLPGPPPSPEAMPPGKPPPASPAPCKAPPMVPAQRPSVAYPADILATLGKIRLTVEDLIAAGEARSLWRWRSNFLLQWRRGVRGLEYSTLALMVREIQNRLVAGPEASGGQAAISGTVDRERLHRELREIRRRLDPFVARAGALLEREAALLQKGPLSPLRCDDAAVQSLREALFGSAMSHGGEFKGLIDALESLWFGLTRGVNP